MPDFVYYLKSCVIMISFDSLGGFGYILGMNDRGREKRDFLAEMDALEYYSKKIGKSRGIKSSRPNDVKTKACPYCDARVKLNYAMCRPCFQKHGNYPAALRLEKKPDPAKFQKVEEWDGVVKRLPTVSGPDEKFIRVPRPTRNRGIMK